MVQPTAELLPRRIEVKLLLLSLRTTSKNIFHANRDSKNLGEAGNRSQLGAFGGDLRRAVREGHDCVLYCFNALNNMRARWEYQLIFA